MTHVNLRLMQRIGKRLKLLRENLGLSQMELCHKSSISQASIARIEAGHQQNIKADTIQKLAAALEIPPAHLLEEPQMISEDILPYETSRMIPVITLQKFITLGSSIGVKTKHKGFEPSLSSDPKALFLVDCASIDSTIKDCDLILIEPSSQARSGDTVLFILKSKSRLGRIYYQPSAFIIQPSDSAAEPIILPLNMRKNRDIKLFKVAEIRKKF